MELLTLSLENFQGLKREEIQLDGHSASIYGRNASGKTTIFNAITWLLFGKPSTWAKNWDPKTKGPNGDLHNLEHSATGTFRLDDGQTVTLKKVFREVWKRKRGSAAEEYSGNTIDYQINGVPCKEKEYMAAVQERRNHEAADHARLLPLRYGLAEAPGNSAGHLRRRFRR